MRARSRFEALYAIDANPDVDASTALSLYHASFGKPAPEDEEEDIASGAPVDLPFAEGLVRDIHANRTELDDVLTRVSRNWRVERMARVDRNILRLGIYELRHRDDVPARVTINEAIELAKRFGAEEAPAFVHGVLDSAVVSLGITK